ncbi:MAG: TIGR00297 family protein [Methanosarcinales archaeon]|nr:MAG: TIGR00297 family protein [Methanosarcinales archaeon]
MTAMHLNIKHEYKRQTIHVLIGMIVLIFPFVPLQYLVLLLLVLFSSVLMLPVSSKLFRIITSSDKATKRRPTGAICLSGSMLILVLVAWVLTFTDYEFPIFLIGGAIAITTFGDGMATSLRVTEQARYNILNNIEYPRRQYQGEQTKPESVKASLTILSVGAIFSFLIGAWIVYWTGYTVSFQLLFFISVIGGTSGALFECISTRIHDNITVPIGSAMTMWLLLVIGYSVSPMYLLFALAFALLLGYLAYVAKIADISGLLSATLVGVLIIAFTNVWWFLLLLTFYLLGGGFTKYKYEYKKSLGIAQGKGGARGYRNVFSNSIFAIAASICYTIFPHESYLFLYIYLGSVATATGDTLASEVGTTYKGSPRMITTLKKVEPGTDGGVSMLGETASILGSLVIGIFAVLFGVIAIDPIRLCMIGMTIVVVSGFAGTNIDSLLGATLQQRGILSNNGVNVVSTLAGGLVAGALWMIVT